MSGKSSFERWRRGCNRRVSLDRVFIQPERYIPIVSSQWVVRHSYLWRCCRRDKRLHNEQFRLEITWHRHQNWWAPFLKKLSTSPYYQQTRRQTNQQTKEKETERKSQEPDEMAIPKSVSYSMDWHCLCPVMVVNGVWVDREHISFWGALQVTWLGSELRLPFMMKAAA